MIQEKLDGKTRGRIWEVRRKTGLEETGRQPGSQTNVEFVFSISKRRGVKGFEQWHVQYFSLLLGSMATGDRILLAESGFLKACATLKHRRMTVITKDRLQRGMGDLEARGTRNQYRKFREAKVSSAHRATAQGEEVLASGLEPSRPSRRGLGLYASVGTRVTTEALRIVVWGSLCKGLIWHKACLKILGLVLLLLGPGSILGLAIIICQGHHHEDLPSNGPMETFSAALPSTALSVLAEPWVSSSAPTPFRVLLLHHWDPRASPTPSSPLPSPASRVLGQAVCHTQGVLLGSFHFGTKVNELANWRALRAHSCSGV